MAISCQKKVNSIEYKTKVTAVLDSIDTSNSNDSIKERTLDTLSQYVLVRNNDSINRNLLFKIADKYYYFNKADKYFEIVNKTYDLSIKQNDTTDVAKSLWYLGDYYNDRSNVDSAYSYYNKSGKLYKTLNDTLMTGRISLYKGITLFDTGNFAESQTETVKALGLLSKTKTKRIDLVFSCYNIIAISLKGLNDFETSLKYFDLALKQLDKLEKENYLNVDIVGSRISCCNNIGRVYEKMRNYPEAIRFYEKGLKTKNIKKKYSEKYAMLLDNLAYSKMQAGDFDKVFEILSESYSVANSSDAKRTVSSNKINFGSYFLFKKDTVKALISAKEGLDLSRKIKYSESTLMALKLLSENDNKNRKYYTNLYLKVSDSIQNVERITRNKFARIAYETDQVEEKNEVLSKRNTLLIIGSAIIIFFLGGFLNIYRLKAKNKELLFAKEQQEANEKIYQLMLRQQAETEQARNEERNRIAMELHDGIVNSIFTTRFNLIQLESGAIDKKQQLVQELERAENEIRRVSHDLKQNLLFEDKTVPEIISNLVLSQQNEYNTKFDLSIDKYIDWSSVMSNAKMQVYRIIQEALQNSNKYSKAENCCVFLLKTGDTITVRIWDNGVGFNPEKAKQGIGLKNIKERVKALNGVLNITSNIGQGTTIEIVF